MLSRTNCPYSSRRSTPNPRPFNLLQPLCRSQKSQLLWNQANPNSFPKTPGVGYTLQKPSCGISSLQPLFPRAVCKPVTPRLTAPSSLALTFRFSYFALRFLSPLCFHNDTNCFSRNPFVFTTIRIAGGYGGLCAGSVSLCLGGDPSRKESDSVSTEEAGARRHMFGGKAGHLQVSEGRSLHHADERNVAFAKRPKLSRTRHAAYVAAASVQKAAATLSERQEYKTSQLSSFFVRDLHESQVTSHQSREFR